MKKISIVILGLFFSMSAFAQDEQVVIDGKHILVTDASISMLSDKPQLHGSDFPGGIYVVVSNPTFTTRFPITEKAIADHLKSKGFKVADKLEDSSASISFFFIGALDVGQAERMAANSYMPNNGQLIAAGGQLANSIAQNGAVGGIVGFVAGELFQTDSKSSVTARILKKPVLFKNFFGFTNLKSSEENGETIAGSTVYYKLEKGNEASADVVLKMVVDQWSKQFLIADAPPAVDLTATASVAPSSTATPPDSSMPVDAASLPLSSVVVSEVDLDNKK